MNWWSLKAKKLFWPASGSPVLDRSVSLVTIRKSRNTAAQTSSGRPDAAASSATASVIVLGLARTQRWSTSENEMPRRVSTHTASGCSRSTGSGMSDGAPALMAVASCGCTESAVAVESVMRSSVSVMTLLSAIPVPKSFDATPETMRFLSSIDPSLAIVADVPMHSNSSGCSRSRTRRTSSATSAP